MGAGCSFQILCHLWISIYNLPTYLKNQCGMRNWSNLNVIHYLTTLVKISQNSNEKK